MSHAYCFAPNVTLLNLRDGRSIFQRSSGTDVGRRKAPVVRNESGTPASADESSVRHVALTRRATLATTMAALAAAPLLPAIAQSLPNVPDPDTLKLCPQVCEAVINDADPVTLPSGLSYKDIVLGKGPQPPVGFQVAANYVAMVPSGKIFDSSLEKGSPYIFRVGSGQVIPGLDEGIRSMKVGGRRRLFIPGALAFPKGLTAAAGRPRVPPATPVIFDVELLYIPGLEDEEEE